MCAWQLWYGKGYCGVILTMVKGKAKCTSMTGRNSGLLHESPTCYMLNRPDLHTLIFSLITLLIYWPTLALSVGTGRKGV